MHKNMRTHAHKYAWAHLYACASTLVLRIPLKGTIRLFFLYYKKHPVLLAASTRRSLLATHINRVLGAAASRGCRAILEKPVLYVARESLERLRDVDVLLGTREKEGYAVLLRQLLALLLRDSDLRLGNIALVSYQHLVHVQVSMLLNLRNPVANIFERAAIGDVVDEQDTLRAAKVRGRDRAEALLSGRIPDLELDIFSIEMDLLDLEVDTDRRDKRGRKRVVRVPEDEARLTNAAIADHQQLDLEIESRRAPSHLYQIYTLYKLEPKQKILKKRVKKGCVYYVRLKKRKHSQVNSTSTFPKQDKKVQNEKKGKSMM